MVMACVFELKLVTDTFNKCLRHAFCRDQLESEKKKREAMEREKEQMEREKQDLMMKLYQFEETTKRAEKGVNLT